MQKNRILKAACATLASLVLIAALPLGAFAIDFTPARNEASTAYQSSPYYDKFSSVFLTGDGRTDVIAVALSQLGYAEGNADGEFSGLKAGSNNFTEYNYNMGNWGVGYGGDSYPWCAAFVSFCLLQAKCHTLTKTSDWCRNHEGDPNYIWREVSCQKWANQLRLCNYFEDSLYLNGDYTPIAGDLIFFTSNGSTESHIGIVLWTDEQNVYTVEGNTGKALDLETNGDGVYLKSYPLDSNYIKGYGVLPYKENTEAIKIDYSAQSLSEGLFICASEKSVYPSADAEEPNATLAPYTQFELIDISSNGDLLILYKDQNKVFTGYVRSDDDRIIQMTCSENIPNEKNYQSYKSTEGFKEISIESYSLASCVFTQKPSGIITPTTHKLKINGYIGFDNAISTFGYYIDGNSDRIVWTDSVNTDLKDSIIERFGKKAANFSIAVDPVELDLGKHNVTFIAKLNDTRVALIDTLSFEIVEINEYLPFSPTIEAFGENSVTLKAIEGYEYKLNDGEWQSENVFKGLQSDTEYSFYQRIAATDNAKPSKDSLPITHSIKKLDDATRLTSLTLNNATLSEEFDSYVTEYTATVSSDATELDIAVTVAEGSTFEISDRQINEDNSTVTVKVISALGFTNTYTITVVFEEVTEATEKPRATHPYVEAESGCGASLSASAFVLSSVLVLGCIPLKKKK